MIRMGVLVAGLATVFVLLGACSFSLEAGTTPSGPESASPSASGSASEETVFRRDGYPISFRYPAAFTLDGQPRLGSSGSARPDDSVALVAGERDAILVQRFTLRARVDRTNLPAVVPEIDQLVAGLAGGAAPKGTPGETAGLPSVSYPPFALSVPEQTLTSRVVVLFDGDREVFLNCQSTPGAAEIPRACDRMLATAVRV